MTAETILILVCAGLLGGMANAMAGGATLITFPAMMAAGLAPIPANASNTVAVLFGNLMGLWADRDKLTALDAAMILGCAIAVAGGAFGALLLLNTPERVFVMIVPSLIGFATLIFAFSKSVQSALAGRFGANASWLRNVLVFFATVYSGYFGAGAGVIMISVFTATTAWDLRQANAFKNLFVILASLAAIVIFIFQGVISWRETLIMMMACMAGGFVGGKALQVISAATMRKVVLAVGVAMTIFYAGKYWL
jgi:uncharacterized protein